MREFDAYCRFCHVNKHGRVEAISALESGNYLYIGRCPTCNNELRRIVPKDSHKQYPDPWIRHMPKGMSLE